MPSVKTPLLLSTDNMEKEGTCTCRHISEADRQTNKQMYMYVQVHVLPEAFTIIFKDITTTELLLLINLIGNIIYDGPAFHEIQSIT